MKLHDFAKELLKQPNLPFQFGIGTQLNRGALKPPFTFEVHEGIINIDTKSVTMGYTDAEQEEVHGLCFSKKDWKDPINAIISEEVHNRIGENKICDILTDATGGMILITKGRKGYRVTGDGYYANMIS